MELDPEKRLTTEQAKNHPFYYTMKHIKPSYITMHVLGNMMDMDGKSLDDISDEDKAVKLPPPANKMAPKPVTRSPFQDITNTF